MPVPRSLVRVAAVLAAGTGLSAALPVVAHAASGGLVIPSDPLFKQQTALQPSATIGAPEAWRLTQGAGVVVAVLDTGVDAAHPDLKGQLWTNPGEIAGNGKDDDHDGFVDDVHGADFVNHDGDPADDEGHGTHIAGIIAARADGKGAVGLAPQAKIMPVKVLDEHRAGNTSIVADGINYALDHGANVINVSINGAGGSDDLRDAIKRADAAGVTIVASAGNDGNNLGLIPSYPASYNDPAVLSVAATDGDSILADFSNFGRGVSLSAPGVSILSTSSTGGYELRSGTSMAAPEAAAALALLHSARPDLPDATLREALVDTAVKAKSLLGKVSAGALDVAAALHQVVPESGWPAAPAAPALVARVTRQRGAKGARQALITWTVAGDDNTIGSYRVSYAGRTVARRGGGSARGLWVPLRKGRMTVSALSTGGGLVAQAKVLVG